MKKGILAAFLLIWFPPLFAGQYGGEAQYRIESTVSGGIIVYISPPDSAKNFLECQATNGRTIPFELSYGTGLVNCYLLHTAHNKYETIQLENYIEDISTHQRIQCNMKYVHDPKAPHYEKQYYKFGIGRDYNGRIFCAHYQ